MEINVIDWLIPVGATNRSGELRQPTYITIHECSLGTGKTPSSYNREYYIHLMEKPKVKKSGYHYLVTDTEVIRFIPDDEIAIHAGTYFGNLRSIGIERLVNVDVNFEKAISIQAKLAATLMKKWNIPISNVVSHKYWSGKGCPARLLAGQNRGWKKGFIPQVQHYFESQDFFREVLENNFAG